MASSSPGNEQDTPDDVPDLISEDNIETPTSVSPSPLASCLKKPSGHTGCSALRTPSSSSTSGSTISSPPSSSLRRRRLHRHRHRPSTGRRVHGLWSNNDETTTSTNNYFELLRDDTLSSILDFLNLADLCRAGMVGRQWKYLVHNNNQSESSSSLWKRVDATEFVEKAFETFSKRRTSSAGDDASKLTGQALERILQPHKPNTLVIRNIQDRLSADHYLPSISSLQELTLTHFNNLTDTHVHVMMLMTLNHHHHHLQKQNPHANELLRVLALEDCSLLTNASIRSIATKCTSLETVSLRGNVQIDDIKPLADLLVTTTKDHQPTLSMMFSPTPKSPPPALFNSLFMPPPPRPSSPPASKTLQSLFAPPGTSPPRKHISKAVKMTSMMPILGNLQHLDVRDTKLTASSLLQCFQQQKNQSLIISLKSLRVNGDTWTDRHLAELTKVVALKELLELDLTCSSKSKIGTLSDQGVLQSLRACSNLRYLNLSGHVGITTTIIRHAPKLQELILLEE
jgi:hypothetical protein